MFNFLKTLLFTSSVSVSDMVMVAFIFSMGGYWLLALIPWFIISIHIEGTLK